MIDFFESESKHKYHISEFLLENADLNPHYREESILLEIESTYWKDLSELVNEIQVTICENPIHMSIITVKGIIDDMVDVLDNIILIEEKIILD
jgi:hypothetical protein